MATLEEMLYALLHRLNAQEDNTRQSASVLTHLILNALETKAELHTLRSLLADKNITLDGQQFQETYQREYRHELERLAQGPGIMGELGRQILAGPDTKSA